MYSFDIGTHRIWNFSPSLKELGAPGQPLNGLHSVEVKIQKSSNLTGKKILLYKLTLLIVKMAKKH